MALIGCRECSKEISSSAVSCPHCGCPVAPVAPEQRTSPSPPIATKKSGMGGLGKTLFVIGGLFIAFLILGATVGNTPEAKEKALARDAIDLCWDEQKRKSIDPAGQRFIAGACERMESDFTLKFGVRP